MCAVHVRSVYAQCMCAVYMRSASEISCSGAGPVIDERSINKQTKCQRMLRNAVLINDLRVDCNLCHYIVFINKKILARISATGKSDIRECSIYWSVNRLFIFFGPKLDALN